MYDNFYKPQPSEKAISFLERAIAEFPKEVSYLNRLADILIDMNKTERAIDVLDQSFKLIPETDLMAVEQLRERFNYRLKHYLLLDGIGQGIRGLEKFEYYFEQNSDELMSKIEHDILRVLFQEENIGQTNRQYFRYRFKQDKHSIIRMIKYLFSKYPSNPSLIYLMSLLMFYKAS